MFTFDNLIVIIMLASSIAVLIYIVNVIRYFISFIRHIPRYKLNVESSFKALLLVIFFGQYGVYLSEEKFEIIDGKAVFETNKKSRNISVALSLLTVLGLCMFILPKIGQGTEVVGSIFENESYTGYHYATLTELDEDYEPVTLEVFAVAEVEKDENGRTITNVYVNGFGTVFGEYSEDIEVFEAPIEFTDIDGKNYDIKVFKVKPELRVTEELYTNVAGVTFKNDDVSRQDILKEIKSGDKAIRLIREMDNKNDENAIIVYSKYGMIGYIKEDLAPYISSILDAGGIVSATVSEITGGTDGKNYGCNLFIQVYKVVEKENYRPDPQENVRN